MSIRIYLAISVCITFLFIRALVLNDVPGVVASAIAGLLLGEYFQNSDKKKASNHD